MKHSTNLSHLECGSLIATLPVPNETEKKNIYTTGKQKNKNKTWLTLE